MARSEYMQVDISNPQTEELRPRQIIRDIGRKWPKAWQQIKMIRAEKGKALPDWPDWCYVPITAGVAVATQGGPVNEQCYDAKLSPAVIAAAAAWRVGQGVYRFDPVLYYTLLNQPLEGNLPCEVITRLPEFCVYIETYNIDFCTIPVIGFWAHLESDPKSKNMELRFVFMCKDGRNMPIAIHLGDWSMEEGVRRSQIEARKGLPDDCTLFTDYIGDLAPLLQLVLYLCAENADMPQVRHPATRARASGMIDAPKEPRIWPVGERVGAAIRKYRTQALDDSGIATGTHSGPRPHLRTAHWHHFWTGPKNGMRKLILKWLPPIPVCMNDDEWPAVIHKVDQCI